jgi:low affinity Fe/Cu permease
MRERGESAAGPIARQITRYGLLVARPLAFLIVTGYGVGWFLFERESFNWNAVATLAIWYMTLLIQRVGHRDTQALQAKLDELLRVQDAARNELTRIDEQEPEEIEQHRQEARSDD